VPGAPLLICAARLAAALSSGRDLSAYVGKSVSLTYVERQEEEGNGKVARPRCLTTPQHAMSRFSQARLGEVDRGIQVTFDLHLVAVGGGGSYRIKADFAIAADGASCTADVSFELAPGKALYQMHRLTTGEPVSMTSVTAERVQCSVAPGDHAGLPAAAEPRLGGRPQ
jgi:hypothetical protein